MGLSKKELKEMIETRPLDFLEAIVVVEENHESLKDIIFRAEIKGLLNEKMCDEYVLVSKRENLKKLQEYALEVYLNQSRELYLSYEKTIAYLCVLLNQNMAARTILSLSPNEFMDEVFCYIPRSAKKNTLKVKNRGEFVHYVMEYHPEDVVEGCMGMQHNAEYLRDIVMQGQIFHMISLEQCKEYRKVVKPANLVKLQAFAKDIWVNSKEENLSYKKIAENICYLLNHNLHLAKLLVLNEEEIQVALRESKEEEKVSVMQSLKELEHIKEMEIIERTGKIPTLQEVQDELRRDELKKKKKEEMKNRHNKVQEEENSPRTVRKRVTEENQESAVRGKREIPSDEV